ncbi:condensation domain-containing protein [Nonomuraea sp. NPDC046570]|uniref:condensation domain-containing protein n=1 Tax=Nonomuraea sp. NPDC046570 TaxID=3155255 RepID=UPI0033EB421E
MTTTLTVCFEGQSDRRGPLTMGQANMARCVRRDPPAHMNFLVIKRLPKRVTLDRVEEATRALISRHEGLRTTFSGDVQHAHGTGKLAVGVHDPGGEARQAAEEVGAELRAARFDLEGELPVRMAVVRERDEPRFVVFVLPHTAVDAISLAQVVHEWDRLLLGTDPSGPPPTQPIDLAATERTPQASRRAASTLRHWRSGLARAPQTMFPVAFDVEHAMLPRLRIRSTAAAAPLERTTRRTGASPSVIVMAALGALVGHRTAQRTCLLASLSSNRTHPRLRGHVGPLAQDALIVADLGAATFDELIGRFRVAALSGYQHSRFDSAELWEAINALDAERGTRYARDCVYNDMSLQAVPGGESPASGDVELTWLPAASLPANLSLWVNRLGDELDLVLWANPAALPREQAEGLGCGLIRLLVEAGDRAIDLADLESVTGVAPASYGADWLRCGESWVRPESVRRLVEAAAPAYQPRITINPDKSLTCHLYPRAPSVRTALEPLPEQVRRACLDLLPGHADAITPHHYVIHPE